MSSSESSCGILSISIGMLFLKVCHLTSCVAIFVGSTAYFQAGVPLVPLQICSVAKWFMLTSISQFNTGVLKMKSFERVSFKRVAAPWGRILRPDKYANVFSADLILILEAAIR